MTMQAASHEEKKNSNMQLVRNAHEPNRAVEYSRTHSKPSKPRVERTQLPGNHLYAFTISTAPRHDEFHYSYQTYMPRAESDLVIRMVTSASLAVPTTKGLNRMKTRQCPTKLSSPRSTMCFRRRLKKELPPTQSAIYHEAKANELDCWS
jgi:hypothetical protein